MKCLYRKHQIVSLSILAAVLAANCYVLQGTLALVSFIGAGLLCLGSMACIAWESK